ncbi:acyltransferase family protein [Planomonospora corallina]|uniref:Acyltransferase family protein n=1 Tax=Planomonospora corallina TaxID=1806052 RepID=A0ABV8I1R4_9ACTN
MPPSGFTDHHSGHAPSRLPSLTGMRFVAAFTVFAVHVLLTPIFADRSLQMFPAPGETAMLLWQTGFMGVSFFFILSGFVLTWSVRPGQSTRGFWLRRFFKIYPNHLLTLVAATVLLGGVSQMPLDLTAGVLNALLVHSFFPQMEIWTAFNSVSWSLSNEAFFYLLFPLLWLAVGRIRPERLWRWAGVVVGVIFTVPLVAPLLFADGPWDPLTRSPYLEFWFTSKFPPVRLLEFVFGMILARIVLTGRKVPLNLGAWLLVTAVVFFVAPYLPLTYPQVAAMVVPLGMTIATGARADLAGRRTWLAGRPMVWLGEISFAFYMCHLLVLNYGHMLLGGGSWDTPAALGIVALLFLASLAVAWLMYTLVEKPVMRFVRSRRAARTAEPAAAAEPVAVSSSG